MSDDDQEKRSGADGEVDDAFAQIAREIAGVACRGRSGFGAFKQFKEAFRRTIHLVESSELLDPNAAGPWNREWSTVRDIESQFAVLLIRETALRPRAFFEGLLGKPATYDPQSLWAFFWALAKAEHDFLTRYTGFWSHEERLTGHLVAVLMERIETFGPHWRALQPPSEGSETGCSLWYADTATARQESSTGADLGLVVHARLPETREYFKVLRFQAKKADERQRTQIDRKQLEVLAAQPGLGHYLFYHRHDPKNWSLPPTVATAAEIAEKAGPAAAKGKAKSSTVDVGGVGVDFATFVAFAATDPTAEYGVLANSSEEAAAALVHSDAPVPSRIVVITLGGGGPRDWTGPFADALRLPPDALDQGLVDD